MWRHRLIGGAVLLAGAAMALPSSAGAPTAATPAMPWLSVAHPAGRLAQIVDSAGRTVLLRGVNVAGIEDDVYAHPAGWPPGVAPLFPVSPSAYDGRCPVNSTKAAEPPVCEVDAGKPEFAQSAAASSRNDFAQIRADGFNVVRLTVSWSLLEPTPGHYSRMYLDRIAQVVGWAREQGIYVLIDMHQDAYSRFTPETAPVSAPPAAEPTYEGGDHADGAPAWAVVADGVPALAPGGQAELNSYVAASFTSFWLNRTPSGVVRGEAPGAGLQDHYIGAVAALASRFRHDSAVAGFELMNEPLPGFIAPGPFETGYLFPFYRRVIDAVTGTSDGVACPTGITYPAVCGYRDLGVHDRQMFFVEPMAARNLIDIAPGASLPFTTYPGIVYAPHAYTHVFTVDTDAPSDAGGLYPPSYDFGLQTATAEARALGAALWIGEYGNGNGDDSTLLAGETAAQDRAMIGSALWQWKGNCAAPCHQSGLWSMWYADTRNHAAQNGAAIPSRVRYLSRVYPRSTAGQLTAMAYDPVRRTFAMTATSTARVRLGDRGRETVVFIPAGVAAAVQVKGAARLDAVLREPDGTRLAYVAPTGAGAGAYTVTIG